MTVAQMIERLELEVLTPQVSLEREITGGCTCDLLSYVMARGEVGTAWVTVQTHLNVIAVASLHEFSCVIVAEGGAVEGETLNKAVEEGIPVLRSGLSEYILSGKLYELGVH